MPQKLEMPQEYEIREMNIAYAWAQIDGCEGGDYLIGLLEAANNAQPGYGYCYGSEQFHHDLLMLLVRDQVGAMKEAATGSDPSQGWDQEAVAAILELEKETG